MDVLRLIDGLDEGIVSLDRSIRITFANRAAASFLESTKDRLVGISLGEAIPGPLGIKLSEKAGEAIAKGSAVTFEEHATNDSCRRLSFRLLPAEDGVTVVIQEIASRISIEGIGTGPGGSDRLQAFVDISSYKETLEALQESEARYRFVTERMRDVVWTLDTDFRTTFVSPSVEKVIGFTPEERMAQDPRDTVTPESFAHALEIFHHEIKLEEEGKADLARTLTFHLEYRHKDGSTVWMENVGSLIHDESGRVTGVHAVSRDITEKRRMEELLRLSEQKFQSAFLSSPDAMTIADLESGMIVDANPAFSSMTFWNHEEVLGKNTIDLGLWVDPGDRLRLVERVTAGELVNGVELKARRRDGEIRDVIVWPRLLDIGSRQYLFSLVHDVTDEMAAAKKLEESEGLLRSVNDNLPQVATFRLVFDTHDHQYLEYVSAGITRLLGVSPEDAIRDVRTLYDLIHPEDLILVQKAERHALQSFTQFDFEVRMRHAVTGEYRWILLRSIPAMREDGATVWNGIFMDISKQKQADQALRESEAKYRFLTEKIHDVVWTVDTDFRLTYVSPSNQRHVGYTLEEQMAMDPQDCVTLESYAYAMELFQSEMERDGQEGVDPDRDVTLELEFYHKDGYTKWSECNASFIRDETGKVTGIYFVSRDVTEKRKAEQALRESEAKYRFLTEKISDVVWTCDMDFRTTYVSPSLERITGYTPEERLGRNPNDMMPPESFSHATELFLEELGRDGLEGVDPDRYVPFELEYYHKNGSRIYSDGIASFIRDQSGKAIGIHAVNRDITERKKAEVLLRQSEQRFEFAFKSSPDPIVITDLETGVIVDANPIFLSGTGYRREEAIGKNIVELGIWDDLSVRDRMVERLKAGQRVRRMEVRARNKDGVMRDVLHWAQILEIGDRKYIYALSHDVTQEKVAAQRLRESEAKFRFLAEKMSDVIITLDKDLRLTYISPSCEKYVGYTPEERMKMKTQETMTPESLERAAQLFLSELERDGQEGVDPDRGIIFEAEFYHTNGSTVWGESNASFIRDESGGVTGIYSVLRDITEKKKVEQVLRESEERLIMAQKAGRVIVFDWEVAANRFFATDESTDLLGIKELRMDIAEQVFTLIHPDDLPEFKEKLRSVMTARMPEFKADHRIVHPDDTERWLSTRGDFYYDETGRPVRMIGTCVDITTLKAVQESLLKANENLEHMVAERTRSLQEANWVLEEQKEVLEDVIRMREKMEKDIRKLAAAIDQAQETITLISTDGVIEYVNPAAEKLTGYTREELIGSSVADFEEYTQYEDMLPMLEGIKSEGKAWTDRHRRRKKSGEEIMVDVAATPVFDDKGNLINLVTVGRDVTREVELQDQIAQIQKMNAIGALASGIAFDLRNTFLPILVNTRLLLESIRVEDPSHVFLGDILQATHHGMDLLEGILTLSRSDIQEKKPVPVSSLVRESVSILKATLPAGIIIRHDLGDCRDMVMADPVQIKQVIISIADNARHAMEGKLGLLSITLATKTLSIKKTMSISLDLEPGAYAEITIKDTGKGMDEETLSLIFEPFFTTQESGQALGMGLSVALGIIKGHKGAITAHSRQGKGSTFTIYLPVMETEVSAQSGA